MQPVHRTSGLGRAYARTAATAATAALAVLALLALASVASASASPEVFIVSHSAPPASVPKGTKYFSTIQAAVKKAKKGDWVLIEPGEYKEEVKVKKANSDIFIRGMNRNTVVLNGEGIKNKKGANGIEVEKASDVWIENLTVKNFERTSLNGSGGNEIWWNGGAESEKIGAHGWYGKYLTAYDTGLNGGYGIFTSNETEGEWENIYASGFNDSGIYIGACPECKAVVNKATMEYNALGYSGSNSGGNMVIEHSVFAHNTTGVAPNSENPGDGPPPQNGACNPVAPLKKHKGALPEFTSTEFAHCTIIRENLITENNDLDLPANTSAAAAPWGAGVELPGDYGDLVLDNTITKNPSDGVLAFEYPNPFPPEPPKTLYFQNTGNRVEGNIFAENGELEEEPYTGDVAFEGGVFGSMKSLNNCISANVMPDGSYPESIEGTWGCQNKTTPNPGGGQAFVEYLLGLQEASENRPEIKAVPAPPAQETMLNPCENVPANNALCEHGKPTP